MKGGGPPINWKWGLLFQSGPWGNGAQITVPWGCGALGAQSIFPGGPYGHKGPIGLKGPIDRAQGAQAHKRQAV